MDGPPDFEVAVAGGALHGWRRGEGPAVIVLHGGPGLSDYTETLAAELEDGYGVTRYQQRGLAPSTTAGPFDIETAVADALGVMDVTSADPVYVVGHSWGGHLAMHLAFTHPGRIRGLVVVDPLGAVGDGGEADLERILAQRIPADAAARAAELDMLAMAGKGSPGDALEALGLVWPAYFSAPEHAPPMPAMSMSLPCYSGTWDSIHHHLQQHTLQEHLPAVRIPTAFVLGADSPIPPRHGVESAALIAGATVEVLEDCGHFLWYEQPGSVRAALDRVHRAATSSP
jgi:proline iminopeptidase